MTDQHRITPPPELMKQCMQEWLTVQPSLTPYDEWMFAKFARWGWLQRDASVPSELQKARDEELEACCEWLELHYPHVYTTRLKRCRRTKPQNLAEQKQAIHDEIHQLLAQISANNAGALAVAEPIRRALERLRELEGNQ